MNTNQARHAMVDGKRLSCSQTHRDAYWHLVGDEFMYHSPTTHLDHPPHFTERDDWYVVEEVEPEPKFRECQIYLRRAADGDEDLCYEPPRGAWHFLSSALHNPDFAGIQMPDSEHVLGLFESKAGPEHCFTWTTRKEIEAGRVRRVDLTKCNVLLRQ